MPRRRVAVTGIGVISPYGVGIDTYWNGLMAGDSNVRPIESLSRRNYRSMLGAQISPAIVNSLQKGPLASLREKGTLFAAVAVNEALAMAGVGPIFSSDQRVGCVLGSLCAGIENLIAVAESYETDRALERDFPIDGALVNFQLEYLTRRHNMTGPSSMVSTACASTTDAIGYGADLIRNGECDAAIVGGGDILAELIHAGFNSLFSITTTTPRPFDKARNGFAIGEGAGMFYLEPLDIALERGARIYAEVAGYGLSNTAFHLTATSDDGVGEALSIVRALDDAGLSADAVDYINTHGTATRHNDQSEIHAIQRVFGARAEKVLANSNKPLIGHCMGAAGAMEAISTVLAIDRQIVPPTPFTQGDEDGMAFDLVMHEPRRASIRHAISQSFGFGGACSCVVFSRCPAEGT